MLNKHFFPIARRALPAILAGALAACSGTGNAGQPGGILPDAHAHRIAVRPTATPATTTQSVSADAFKTAVLADAPTAYYRLDDSGSSAADSSGNALTGAVGSSVQKSVSGLVSGSADSAMAFPGYKSSAGIVRVPQSSKLQPSSSVSLETLLRFASTPAAYAVPVAYGNGGTYLPYGIFFSYGKIATEFYLTSGVLVLTSPTTVKTNTTYHVVATFDGSTGRLYINGALAASGSKSGTLRGYTSGYGLAIGDDTALARPAYKGTVDEVAVYANKALSASRVAAHYYAAIASSTVATPAPTAAPTVKPTAAPTATASPAASSGNQATYAGCGIYPADDVYNKNVSTAAVDPYSSTTIAGLPSKTWWMPLPANERANLATNATPVQTVKDSYNVTFSVPWSSAYYIEPGDSHSIELNTSTCKAVLSYGTRQSSGIVSFTAARTADYTKPFVAWSGDGGGAMASGLDIFAGAIKDSDIASGAIRHVLNLGFPTGQGVSQSGYVFPAGLPTRLTCTSNCTHPLHYGDHLRLKASYTCPSAASYPQANMICVALKTYGAFYADQASYMELYFLQSSNGSSPYNATDISHFNPPVSAFEVLARPQVLCWRTTSCT